MHPVQWLGQIIQFDLSKLFLICNYNIQRRFTTLYLTIDKFRFTESNHVNFLQMFWVNFVFLIDHRCWLMFGFLIVLHFHFLPLSPFSIFCLSPRILTFHFSHIFSNIKEFLNTIPFFKEWLFWTGCCFFKECFFSNLCVVAKEKQV